MRFHLFLLLATLFLPIYAAETQQRHTPKTGYREWKVYGGGTESIRYSNLDQINRNNVQKLAVAWTFDTGDAFDGSEMQCNPIVVNGVLYITDESGQLTAYSLSTS